MAATYPPSPSCPFVESNVTKRRNLSNGSIPSVGSWKKRLVESTVDLYSGDNPKFKRAKVSANRDFPKGCGRFAAIITDAPSLDNVVVDTAGILSTGVECVASLQLEIREPHRISVEYESTESLKNADQNELMELSSGVAKPVSVDLSDPMELAKGSDRPGPMELSKSSDQHEIVEPMKNSEQFDVPELLKDSDQHEEPFQLSLSCIEAQVEVVEKTNAPLQQQRVSAVRDFPYGTGRNSPQLTREEILKFVASSRDGNSGGGKSLEEKPGKKISNAVKAEKLETEVKGEKPIKKTGNLVIADTPVKIESELEGNRTKESVEKVQVRAASDVKIYNRPDKHTPGSSKKLDKVEALVGKSSAEKLETEVKGEKPIKKTGNLVIADTPVKIESELEGNRTKESVEKVQVRAASDVKIYNRSDKHTPGSSKKLDKVEALVGKSSAKKSVKAIKDKTSMSIVLVGSDDRNDDMDESQGEETDSLDVFRGKEIVQALMAEPYCPWRQGKRIPKIKPSSSPLNKGKSKAKKEENSMGKVVKSKDTTLIKKKQLPPKGEASSEVKDRTVFKDEEDSLPQEGTNLLSMLDGEEENLPDDDDVDVPTSAPKSQELSVSLIPFGVSGSHRKGENDENVTRNKVRETLRLFQVIFRKLLQEEETTKRKEQGKRIDLLACKLLKEKNKYVNTGKQILGIVPGVEVGDEFHYRVELCIIGLHRQIQGGIDYVKQGNTILATSIVASGGYADDMDSSDVLVYSGSGGTAQGDKQPEDQKLERGNLALKNSIDSKTPVRVIRGSKELKNDGQDTRGKSISTYTYDGFYLVEKYWKEKGPQGFSVFKFQLRRMSGQPELAWKIVKQVKKSKKSAPREGLCVEDISQGQEKKPICAVNTNDDDRPPPFKYITKMIYPDWYEPTPPRGCDCTNGCSDSQNCACAVKNGGEIPFNHNGAIVEAKPLVYECGPLCSCPPNCHNRVSQHGIKFQLEIFKTDSRGWGVRSLTSIPSGSFICEYTGELLRDTEAEQRTGNDEYLFDIGHNYNDRSLWDGLSTLIPDLYSSASCDVVENVGFTIDAAEYGNVGRFINHSCSPNLYAQNVLYDHDDKKMPHIMLFAAENIPPLQELTYHYNYTVDQVHDSDGNIKRKNCYCGSQECSGRLY